MKNINIMLCLRDVYSAHYLLLFWAIIIWHRYLHELYFWQQIWLPVLRYKVVLGDWTTYG